MPESFRPVTLHQDLGVYPCQKVVVRATLVTPGGAVFASENHIRHLEPAGCPRASYPHGEGYHLCREVCLQDGHAEENVLAMAGERARGGVIFLEGHWRVCDGCRRACAAAGVAVFVHGSGLSSLVEGEP